MSSCAQGWSTVSAFMGRLWSVRGYNDLNRFGCQGERSVGTRMVSIHDTSGLAKLRERWRIEPGHVRRLRNAFYKKQRSATEALREIPEARRHEFGAAL